MLRFDAAVSVPAQKDSNKRLKKKCSVSFSRKRKREQGPGRLSGNRSGTFHGKDMIGSSSTAKNMGNKMEMSVEYCSFNRNLACNSVMAVVKGMKNSKSKFENQLLVGLGRL